MKNAQSKYSAPKLPVDADLNSFKSGTVGMIWNGIWQATNVTGQGVDFNGQAAAVPQIGSQPATWAGMASLALPSHKKGIDKCKDNSALPSLNTYLYVQKLIADGLSLTGKPTRLVHNDQSWEGNVVEAPQMFKHNSKYYLFISGNSYAGVNYAVGYATCQTVTGPCTDASNNPILASKVNKQPFVIGPGGQSVVQVGNQTWIFYHAWNVNPDGSQGDSRFMWLDRINWNIDAPAVQGPTTSPEPMPITTGS